MRTISLIFLTLFAALLLWTNVGCTPNPNPTLGAGFRFSTYGPPYDPGADYWAGVGRDMAARFPNATPQAIWIVGNYGIKGPVFTFPSAHENFNIHFTSQDRNEEALTLFDQIGLQVWLQVEPGDAAVEDLIRIMLDRYGHHSSVIGIGVDVEWFRSDGTPEGQAVSDDEAALWVATARSYDPNYRVFLKHWEQSKMPPTYRDGLVFVDDSQQFDSFEHMIEEFSAWGEYFAPSPVGFQYGYPADRKWWRDLEDAPGDIGRQILDHVPNTAALFWVDFTVLDVFPVQK